MPTLCLGTAQFGSSYGIANESGIPPLAEVKDIIYYANQHNVTFIDTAQAYGESENILGEALRSSILPNSPRIITKLSPNFQFIDKTSLEDSVKSSLERLGVTSIWGLLLHRPHISGNWERFINTVTELKKRGSIRNFGVSIYEPSDALHFIQQPWLDIIQVPFNVLDRRLIDNGFFENAVSKGKIVFVRSIFLQGLLLLSNEQVIAKKMDWANQYLDILRQFINRHSLNIRSFVFEAVSYRFPELVLIFGAEKKKQVVENIDFASQNKIPTNLISEWWDNLPPFPEKILNPSLWN